MSNLDLVLSFLPEPAEWARDAAERVRQGLAWNGVGLIAAWEIQSQLATLTLVALLAVVPIVPTLAVMLCWSFVAGAIYCYGRRRGLPDLLEEGTKGEPDAKPCKAEALGWVALSIFKAWLAGIQPFIYSRTVCRLLVKPANCWRMRLARGAVLTVGLTLFGVTTAHHMLRKAGYSEGRIFRLSLVGSCLNVPYRILLSAAVINLATHFVTAPV